jgi:hypothetical protein
VGCLSSYALQPVPGDRYAALESTCRDPRRTRTSQRGDRLLPGP